MLEISQHRLPALRTLAVAVLDCDQLLLPVRTRSDEHEGAEPLILQAHVKVHPVRPHIDVIAILQAALAKLPVLLLPDPGQPRDICRRQTRGFLPEQCLERRPEVPCREPPQIQNRQHLGHLRRATHIGRQEPAREPAPLSLFVDPSVVDSRGTHLQRARTAGDTPRPRLPVAHHEPAAIRVTGLGMPLHVGRHFLLQRTHQHPPRAFPRELVQHVALFPSNLVLDYLQHGWRLLPPAFAGVVFDSHGRIRRLSHASHPQLWVIPRWRGAAQWDYFEAKWKPKSWKTPHRFLFLRTRVKQQHKEPIQLDLFVPHEYGYEFKVILTNKPLGARRTLVFHNGRGSQEGILAELKSDNALAYVPTRTWVGNQIYLLSVLLAHNLVRELQMIADPPSRATLEKRPAFWVFERLDTFRRRILQRAGRLIRPQGQLTLSMSANPAVQEELLHYLEALQAA